MDCRNRCERLGTNIGYFAYVPGSTCACYTKDGNCGYDGNYLRGGQGPCNYCGPEGYCCRKEKSGWWDKTSGCDGTFGGETGHRCAAKPGIILVVLNYLYLS